MLLVRIFCFIFIMITPAYAQLNIDWASHINFDHSAIIATPQNNTPRFGRSLASTEGVLIIGSEYYNSADFPESGAVFVLNAAENDVIAPLGWTSLNGRYSQSSFSGATPEHFDNFGAAVSVTKTFDDVIKILVGTPKEDIGSIVEAGMVHEILISAQGVDFANYHQNTAGIQGESQEFDRMGSTVIWGDFDNNNRIDAAVGVPLEDLNGNDNAGFLHVIRGGNDGFLDADNNRFWNQNLVHDVDTFIEEGDSFGRTLAVGDFNGDQYDDLVIAAPFEDEGNISNSGAVSVIYGSSIGLSFVQNDFFVQESLSEKSEQFDTFGSSLTIGDFNGDGVDDLAIGVPGKDIGESVDAGVVHVIFGDTINGLDASNAQIIRIGMSGLNFSDSQNNFFGHALTSGNFNNDAYDELVISATGVDYTYTNPFTGTVFSVEDGGVVFAFYGSDSGIQTSGNAQHIFPHIFSEIQGTENDMHFGQTLTSDDFDNDGKDDLTIGNQKDSVTVVYQFGHVIFNNGFE